MIGYRYEYGEWTHRNGRGLIFLGDFTDYGPDSLSVLRTVMELHHDGVAHSVMGNHDNKLMRSLKGNPVIVGEGLASTLAELEDISAAERTGIEDFLSHLPPFLAFRIGKVVENRGIIPARNPHPILVIAHAGISRDMLHSEWTSGLWSRCIYGDVDKSRTDELGRYHRDYEWTTAYDDDEYFCVYGHTFVPGPDKRDNTINIDTGPVKGGGLTAFRWPERETVTFFTDTDYRGDKI